MGVIGINMPVKLIALAEGALTGFTDEAFDVPHVMPPVTCSSTSRARRSERLAVLASITRHTWSSSARPAGPRSCRTATSTLCS